MAGYERFYRSPLSARDVRRIRKSLGLTQVQFGELIGVTSVTVSRWETAQSGVPVPTARLIMSFDHLVKQRAKEQAKKKVGR